MKVDVMSALEFQRRDRARVDRNDEALRRERIDAKRAGEAFDEAAFAPPEPEPENVFMAGGNRVALVMLEKGDPYKPEEIAAEVRDRLGDYNERQDPRGMAGTVR